MAVNCVRYYTKYHYKTPDNKTKIKRIVHTYYYNDNPNNITEYVYAKMRNLMEENNITNLEDIATSISLTRQSFSNWKNGKGSPSVEVLQTICNFFNITIGDFFKDQYTIKSIANQKKDEYIASDGHVLDNKLDWMHYEKQLNKKCC